MTLPVTIPNTFANATTSIPLANLDANFVTIYDTVNGIGNGAETLANVQISGGNATFTTANVTTLDLTNIEVTNIKAKDGTAAIAIADSTGVTTQSTPAIISVNSASDALRITQTGAGNALLVEDSTNPDATPFVINATGQIVAGTTTAPTTGLFSLDRPNNDSGGIAFDASKNRSGAIVQNNDTLFSLRQYGYDGASYVQAAQIVAAVDGTPGTNDMPGRLVFSTTADGASSPTERMRIDSTGAVGIGTTSLGASYGLRVAKTFAGDNGSNIFSSATGSSSTPTGVFSFRSTVATASNGGTPYTITSAYSYTAAQGTFNADSTITNQFGFRAESSLTGATNNYGFYSSIASGSGRWNFYANGTAANYMAGTLEVGSTIGVGDATPAASGAGITFPATASASSDANTLDDYEEGTWTPTLSAVANCSSLSLIDAWYVKIGGLVTYSLRGDITVTSANTKTSFYFTQAFAQSTITDNQGGSAMIEGPNPFPYAAGTALDASSGNSNTFVAFGASAVNFNGASTFYVTGCFKAS